MIEIPLTLSETIIGQWYLYSYNNVAVNGVQKGEVIVEDATEWVMDFQTDSTSSLTRTNFPIPEYNGTYTVNDSTNILYIKYRNPNAVFYWEVLEYSDDSFSTAFSHDEGSDFKTFKRIE